MRRLVVDEFALHKGHRYATVVMDAQTMRVLWVGDGNSREAIRPFFELFGKEGCKAIGAVAMDMTRPSIWRCNGTAHRRKSSMTCFMWWPASGGGHRSRPGG